MVVQAEHYRSDGTGWFTENYVFQGREGLKQKRKTNAQGRLLMDDATVAPGAPKQFLPPGREWARHPAPHMAEESIIGTITSIHKQRLVTGWPTGVDVISSKTFTNRDAAGVSALLAKFGHLAGREFTV